MTALYLHDAATPDTGTLPPATGQTTTAIAGSATPSSAGVNLAMDVNEGTTTGVIATCSVSGTGGKAWFLRRFLSAPMPAQTFTLNDVYGVPLAGDCSSSSALGSWNMLLYVWRPSTGAIVSWITASTVVATGNTIPSSTLNYGNFTATQTQPTFTCQAGDILVEEIYAFTNASMSLSGTINLVYDGNSTTSAAAFASNCNPPATIAFPINWPTTGILDAFNEANGPMSSNWTNMSVPVNSGTMPQIVSAQCVNPAGNGWGAAYYNAISPTDCEVYVTLPNPAACNQWLDLWLSFTPGTDIGAQNGYYLRYGATAHQIMIQKQTGGGSGSITPPGQISLTCNAGDSIGAGRRGNVFSIYYKPAGGIWQQLGASGTDATYPGAACLGLRMDPSGAMTNFGGGTPVVPPTPKSSSDTNGTTTESGSVHNATSGADNNSTTTETPTLHGALSDVDANTLFDDSQSSVVQKLSLSTADTNGTTTEAGVLTYQAAGADSNGATTETATFTYVAVGSDVNGATTEVGTAYPQQQIAGTDANSSTTESASITHEVLAGADANSSTTELAGFTAQLAGADVNSSTTEAASTTVTPFLVTDVNGATTESATGQVAVLPVSGTDANGTTTESGSTVVRASATDSNGSTTETTSLQAGAAVSASDANGSLTEATITQTTATTSDSGAGIETSAVTVAVSASDADSATTETATTNVPVSAADFGSGTDSGSATSLVSAADTNSSTAETGTTTAGQLTSSDTNGPTAETSTLGEINQIAGFDSGAGSDSALVAAGQILATDSNGLTVEASSLYTAAQKADADSGTSQEVTSLFAQITPAGDAASATESASAGVYVYDVDAGIGTDVGAVTRSSIFDTDLGVGSDIGSTAATILAADAGTVSEMAGLAFFANDNGAGLDYASLAALLNDYDSGYGAEVYNRWPPLTLFPPIPAGDILAAPMGELVNVSARGYIRRQTPVKGTLTSPARGRILS